MKLKKFLALTCSTLLLSSLFLGCGPKKDEEATQDKNSNVLYVYNWGDYIDPELLTKFKEETGIDVKYDVYDTNEIMYQKLNSGNVSYDIVIPSDYMIEKMKNEDMLAKIDYSNIPNYKYIGEQFKKLAYDPTDEYSVPYMWGTVGIIYNTKRVSDPVDSWNILWNPKYKDQVIMPDSVRDAIAVAEKKLGYSLNTENLDQIEDAKKELMTQKKDGLILAYMVDQVKDAMVGGEASLAVAWSGDAVTMIERNPDLAYAIPKEGSNKWFDAIAIPKNAKHKENAEKFINFLCDPENAEQNVEYIGYSTPNTAAYELLPEDIKNDKVAYPDEESLKNCEVFIDLPSKILRKYDEAWLEIKCVY
ncbi:TPA: ABC transporter substrate-binding protein [Clostridium perfringens]|uniref:ABC transporter substrate-binding protein n=1 Tax=Clostridium perfringens TaxID=1502 RepID=UPI001A24B07A|nr:ABC transporter substrate-binding protein [Clostridium perfringens]MCI2777945.1 ABC transporter substrate-binding protein [Clostridium perfringens]HAT4245549.1 ABC transporter substrate-binding protein [Clostridium perfringens]